MICNFMGFPWHLHMVFNFFPYIYRHVFAKFIIELCVFPGIIWNILWLQYHCQQLSLDLLRLQFNLHEHILTFVQK